MNRGHWAFFAIASIACAIGMLLPLVALSVVVADSFAPLFTVEGALVSLAAFFGLKAYKAGPITK
jgi:hypothetical protein